MLLILAQKVALMLHMTHDKFNPNLVFRKCFRNKAILEARMEIWLPHA